MLLPPNSRFKVLGQLDAGNGLVIIQMKELPPKDPIIDFDAVLAPAPAPAPAPVKVVEEPVVSATETIEEVKPKKKIVRKASTNA